MDVQFPLFGFETDDRSMFLIESADHLLHHCEPIDIENDEYLFWDANGAGVRIVVARDAVKQTFYCEHEMTLADALQTYAKAYGLKIPGTESPMDAWRTLQAQLPQKKSFWSRLSGKG